jgi:hypothetical protein
MKAILEFNLDDFDDSVAHMRCVQALDMALALWEIRSIRNQIENQLDHKQMDSHELLDKVFEEFYGILENKNINLDKILI